MSDKKQESPESGERRSEPTPARRDKAPKIEDAAEERKDGGRAPKMAGGVIKKNAGGPIRKKVGGPVKKNVGGIAGSSPAPSAARAPRKGGGSCVSNPMSSAASGTKPKGHSAKDIS